MSRSFNTLKTSDVTTTPIKLKYTASYDSSSLSDYGIKVMTGTNNPISISGVDNEEALVYRSIRHLYYSNYLTGSFPVSSSTALNWEQSTAASGTVDADLRYFPTESNTKINVASIPRLLLGEKISRGSFTIRPTNTSDYYIVDDGNGNLIDIESDSSYVNANYYTPQGNVQTAYVVGPPKNTHVGNILYAQGMVIITNPDYLNVLKGTVTTLEVVDNLNNSINNLTVNGESKQIPPKTSVVLYTEPFDVVLNFLARYRFTRTYTATTQIVTATATTTYTDQFRIGPGRYTWQLTTQTVPLGSVVTLTFS